LDSSFLNSSKSTTITFVFRSGINNHVRTAALVGLAASAYLTYLTFTKEDEINAALGKSF